MAASTSRATLETPTYDCTKCHLHIGSMCMSMANADHRSLSMVIEPVYGAMADDHVFWLNVSVPVQLRRAFEWAPHVGPGGEDPRPGRAAPRGRVPSPWWASILPPTHRCGRHRTGIIIACGQNIPDAQRLAAGRNLQLLVSGLHWQRSTDRSLCSDLEAGTRRTEATTTYILTSTPHAVAADVKKQLSCRRRSR
jgi:hypothetical protein